MAAKRSAADVLVTHDPRITIYCSIFARILGFKGKHLGHSFNWPELPSGLRLWLSQWALQGVDRFVVYSSIERSIYSKHFSIPADRFDVRLWAQSSPDVSMSTRLEAGNYVCAIGGNGRDYKTMIEAAALVPEIPIIAVVRPHSLQGLNVPANVKVHVNLPYAETMNVLAHSRFMVLPLMSRDVPCGHVTLVCSMQLSKAVVVTSSTGVADYVRDGENGLSVDVGDAVGLASALRDLWQNLELCHQMGEAGRAFAAEHCAEHHMVQHFEQYLRSIGQLPPPVFRSDET
jgi:glycosyltransferase involved in cell wall biosynthesis